MWLPVFPFLTWFHIFILKQYSDLNFNLWICAEQEKCTWRNHRLPSPTRINAFLCLWFCLWVRAKRGIKSKRVFYRKIGNLSFSVHWRNTMIIHYFLLAKKFFDIFEKQSLLKGCRRSRYIWETIVIVRLLHWRNTTIIHKFLLAQKGLDIFEKQ